MSATLAISGGAPAVPAQLGRFRHPDLDLLDLATLVGPEQRDRTISFDGRGLVAALEEAFGALTGVPYSIAANSGTSALYSAFAALGLGPGDDVLVPAYTFFATAMPLFRLGCRPVLVDCRPDGNIDPAEIERRRTPATRAVVITHMWGIPCAMAEIVEVAGRLGLHLVEDASHAHGATYRDRVVGSFGAAGCWSLGAAKIVTGGQGGMLQTPDADLAERARLLGRANDKLRDRAVTNPRYQPYAVSGIGLNLRIHPMAAAVVLAQLPGLGAQLRQRREIADRIRDGLAEVAGLELIEPPAGTQPAWYALPLRYDSAAAGGITRDEFVAALVAEGAVEADVPSSTRPLADFAAFNGSAPTFAQAPARTGEVNAVDFPYARRFQETVIKLPGWYGERGRRAADAYLAAIHKVATHPDEVRSSR